MADRYSKTMRVYTVHLRRQGLDPDRDIMLVKEGFCWPALLFSILWALWCRLWWVALGLLVVEVALSGAVALLGLAPLSEVAISLGFAVIVGFGANDLKRWTLRRQGFVEVAVVVAETLRQALASAYSANPRSCAQKAKSPWSKIKNIAGING